MDLVNKEDSYAARRELFKTIWQAAMQIDEKDDIIKKPKVIKTLRLDEMDKYSIGKSKKERINSLRVVCNKILDFCNRQEADDILFEQMIGGHELSAEKIGSKSKKPKCRRIKKKVRKVKSLFASPNDINAVDVKATTSSKKNNITETRHLRAPAFAREIDSPLRFNKTSVIRRALVTNYSPTSKLEYLHNKPPTKSSPTRRKVIRKKRTKRKTFSNTETAPAVPTDLLDGLNL